MKITNETKLKISSSYVVSGFNPEAAHRILNTTFGELEANVNSTGGKKFACSYDIAELTGGLETVLRRLKKRGTCTIKVDACDYPVHVIEVVG